MADKLTVYVRSQWNADRSSGRALTTQNAVWGGMRYDRNIRNKNFSFASYDFESDRPNKLNFRSVIGGGLGRHAVKNDKTEIDLLLGGAWNRTWQPGTNGDIPELLAGTAIKHNFHPRLKVQTSFTFYQNPTDRAESRFLYDSTLSGDITKKIGWFITYGDRFNSDPLPNTKKNDSLLTTGIRWNFGKKK